MMQICTGSLKSTGITNVKITLQIFFKYKRLDLEDKYFNWFILSLYKVIPFKPPFFFKRVSSSDCRLDTDLYKTNMSAI